MHAPGLPLRRLLVSGTIWAFGGRLIAVVANFGVNLLLARALSPDSYGAFFIAWSVATLAVAIGVMGVDQVTIRLIAESRAANHSLQAARITITSFLLALSGGVLVSLALWILGPWLFGSFFQVPILKGVSLLLALWALTNVLLRQAAESFRGYHDLRSATLFNGLGKSGILPSSSLFIGAAILFTFALDSLTFLYTFMVIASGILVCTACLVLWRTLSKDLGQAPARLARKLWGQAPKPGRLMMRILGTTAPVFLTVILAAVRVQADIWILGSVAPAAEVAIYGSVLRMVILIVTPLSIVNAVLPPIIATMNAQGKLEPLEQILRAISTLVGIMALVTLATFSLFGADLLGLIYGSYYRVGAPLLIILGFGHLINASAGSCDFVLLMTGHERSFLIGTLLGTSILLLFGYLGALFFGSRGLAIAAAGALVAQNLFWLLAARRQLGIWTHLSFRPGIIRRGIVALQSR